MPTIIGFVPKDNVFDSINFPVGWKSDGVRIDNRNHDWARECQLLLLDDNRYAATEIQGINNLALLVQHLTTPQDQKIAQQAKLNEWGWRTAQIEEFSRIEGSYRFYRDIKVLLANESDDGKNKSIIEAMVKRYEIANTVKILDTLAAWFILFNSAKNDMNSDTYLNFKSKFHRLFDDLPFQKKKSLYPLINDPIRFLNELNSITIALIS